MVPLKIGIISDTHLTNPSPSFQQAAQTCFAEVDMIFHAGDLTNPEILEAFGDKKIHAVHGNMCGPAACKLLPTQKEIKVGNFTIGLIHRIGNTYDFEDRLLEVFPTADCIIYGHTHQPVCHKIGRVLYINPGSFTGTGYRGAGGTFAILEVGESLEGRIYQLRN
jgi:putative phosphoesterase